MRLTKTAFRAWLKTQPQHQVVGHPRSACDCPIATCIKATEGVTQIHINYNEIRIGTDVRPWPAWMHEFIAQVDDVKNTAGITAKQALSYL